MKHVVPLSEYWGHVQPLSSPAIAAPAPSGIWGGAPAEIEFGAFFALKSDIRWQLSIIFLRIN